MRKGNTVLLDALNKVLPGMTADDFNAIMADAIAVQPHRLNGKRTVLLQQTQGQGAPHCAARALLLEIKRYFLVKCARMTILEQLGSDIVKLWDTYASIYLTGMWKTVSLAVICTLVGCLIGFLCGVLQTIPVAKKDNSLKKGFLAVRRAASSAHMSRCFAGHP
ncbi:MAG: hypothetical protein R2881_04605 [Eubacteriales bacterium]